MRRAVRVAVAVAVLTVAGCAPVVHTAAAKVVSGPVFEDFLGPAGTPPNPAYWSADIGSSAEHGWERGSLQTYTGAPDNLALDGYGNLVITARRSGGDYTSARITSRSKLSFPYGTVAARIKFPSGQGLWPAFWMVGADIDTVGWPACGEIDIMEIINTGTRFNIALHGPGADVEQKGSIDDLTGDFHTYWMNRREGAVTVGVDDATLATFTAESLPDGAPWVFDGPMFVLLNLAVGGDWPGPPDSSTPFPSAMVVDWFSFQPPDSADSQE